METFFSQLSFPELLTLILVGGLLFKDQLIQLAASRFGLKITPKVDSEKSSINYQPQIDVINKDLVNIKDNHLAHIEADMRIQTETLKEHGNAINGIETNVAFIRGLLEGRK